MEFILDAKKSKDPRMFLYPSDRRNKFNETWTLRRDDMQCKSMQVYIRVNKIYYLFLPVFFFNT